MNLAFKWLTMNSSRVYLERFLRRAASEIKPGSRVLDAGAGDEIYRSLFSQTHYESTDFGQSAGMAYAPMSYVSDLAHLPIQNDSYDALICTQVLEHVPNPQQVLNELFRVMKPGGQLWLTTPLFFEEHMQPHDFFRYTRFGLQHLLSEAGFVVEKIEELEGYHGTLAYQMRLAARAMPISPAAFGGGLVGVLAAGLAIVLKPTFALLSLLWMRLDLRHKWITTGMCKNFSVVAQKV